MECKDRNCPLHGTISTRGSVLDGTVVSDKMQSTIVVERVRFVKIKKYDRYKRKTSRIPAHNPACIDARVGDKVKIMECRKLSKTKSFVVVSKGDTEQVEEKPKKQEKPKKITKKVKAKKEVENG